MTTNLEASATAAVIYGYKYKDLEKLVIERERHRLVGEGEGLAVNCSLGLRVKVSTDRRTVTQPAGDRAKALEARRAESSANLVKRLSIFFSTRKDWLEENKKMLVSEGGPTGRGVAFLV